MSTFTIKAEKYIEHLVYDDTISMKLDIQETLGGNMKIAIDQIDNSYYFIVTNVKKEDLETLKSLFNNRMYYIISEEEIGTIAEFMEHAAKKRKYTP